MSAQLTEHCLTLDVCVMCLGNASQINFKALLSWDESEIPPPVPSKTRNAQSFLF